MHRAAHQLLDRPAVFDDPLALRIIGVEAERELRSGGDWHGRASSGLRAFIAARSRLAEDTLKAAQRNGIRQYVLLGAGLDTFAYRFPEQRSEQLTVFEVDYPATQTWKQSRLAEAGIAIPPNVVYAPVNFEAGSLEEGLKAAGINFCAPAVFAWLGVTPYLTRAAVLGTLSWLAKTTPKASQIVFDYAEPSGNGDASWQAGFARMAERVAALGEPFLSFFEAKQFARELQGLGFSRVEDFDSEALNALYFSDRADGLKVGGRGHVMRLTV